MDLMRVKKKNIYSKEPPYRNEFEDESSLATGISTITCCNCKNRFRLFIHELSFQRTFSMQSYGNCNRDYSDFNV